MSPRALWLMGAAAVIGFLLWRQRPAIKSAYESWRYPPASSAGPLARPIEEEVARDKERRLRRLYARVLAGIEASRREGFQVDGLKARAEAAMSLAEGPYGRQALEELSRVELAIPRRGEQYLPLYPKARPKAAKRRARRRH